MTMEAPTLAWLNAHCDNEAAVAWLIPQLTDLAVFSNSQKVLDDYQVESLASVIANSYGYLRLTELMMFFQDFKSGKYGRFYSSVSPLSITSALRQFVVERNELLSLYEARRASERRRREEQQAVTYEEYLAMKQRGELPSQRRERQNSGTGLHQRQI